jgi:ABC-type branched-subunit amino acid transport system ATPase component
VVRKFFGHQGTYDKGHTTMEIAQHHLEIHNLSLNFGGVQALNRVDLKVKRGSLFSLIGPNGAGKTSLINCISKFYEPKEGKSFQRP